MKSNTLKITQIPELSLREKCFSELEHAQRINKSGNTKLAMITADNALKEFIINTGNTDIIQKYNETIS